MEAEPGFEYHFEPGDVDAGWEPDREYSWEDLPLLDRALLRFDRLPAPGQSPGPGHGGTYARILLIAPGAPRRECMPSCAAAAIGTPASASRG
jgi:hypothetical protein